MHGTNGANPANGKDDARGMNATNYTVKHPVMTARVGEGVYAGRRIVRYEEYEESGEVGNLIDLY